MIRNRMLIKMIIRNKNRTKNVHYDPSYFSTMFIEKKKKKTKYREKDVQYAPIGRLMQSDYSRP